MGTTMPSCISISPSAIDLKRYDRALITITCRPCNASRIKEIIRIEWDLHSIEVHIHAIGFSKSTKHLHQRRGKRKRSLKKMRNEDSDKCESVQSSMESSKNTSLQNSARAMRRRRSRKPKLSPTIRREKAFTAAPFSSPAPKKLQNNFRFGSDDNSDGKEQVGFTPNIFKKRRVIDPICDEQRKRLNFKNEIEESVVKSVVPIQTFFRCYLAQKNVNKQIECERMRQRQNYYFGVIKSQIMTKRVRRMYLKYKSAAIIIQSSIRSYCAQKQCNEQINMEQIRKENEERIRREKEAKIERLRLEQIRKEEEAKKQRLRQEQIRIEREKAMLGRFIHSMLECNKTRTHYLEIKRACIVIQSVFKT